MQIVDVRSATGRGQNFWPWDQRSNRAGSPPGADLAGIQRQTRACDASAVRDLAWAIASRQSNGQPGARVGLYVRGGTPFGRDGVGVELGAAGTSEPKRAAGHVVPGAAWAFHVAAIGVTPLPLTGDRRPSKYDRGMRLVVAAGGATAERHPADPAPPVARQGEVTPRPAAPRGRRRR